MFVLAPPEVLLKLKTPALVPLLYLPPRMNHGLDELTKLAFRPDPYHIYYIWYLNIIIMNLICQSCLLKNAAHNYINHVPHFLVL